MPRKKKASTPTQSTTQNQDLNLFPDGTPVDIYTPCEQPAGIWHWVTGYRIGIPETNKIKHQVLRRKVYQNPLTGELERTYAVMSETNLCFPIVRSHVRRSDPSHTDLWNYPRPKETSPQNLSFQGFVVADESDHADLEELAALEAFTEKL